MLCLPSNGIEAAAVGLSVAGRNAAALIRVLTWCIDVAIAGGESAGHGARAGE